MYISLTDFHHVAVLYALHKELHERYYFLLRGCATIKHDKECSN